MIFKYLILPFYFVFVQGWAINYQNKFGCVAPDPSQTIMGGKVQINNQDITLLFQDSNGNNLANFQDINEEVILKIDSLSQQNILLEVNHGLLIPNTGPDFSTNKITCSNKRIFSTIQSSNWLYKWLPNSYEKLQVTIAYVNSYAPVKLAYFNLPYYNLPNSTTTIPTAPTIPTVFPTTKNYPSGYTNYANFRDISLLWYIENEKLFMIVTTTLDNCNSWFSIGFSKKEGEMTQSDAIIGWGNNNCELNIDAFYLPEESKIIGSKIFDYRKPADYLITKKVSFINKIFSIEFSRLLNTGNFSDTQIFGNKTNLIYAIGDKMNQKSVSYHYEDGSFNIDLLTGNVADNSKKDNISKHYISIVSLIIFTFYFGGLLILTHVKKFHKLYNFFYRNINLYYLGIHSLAKIIFYVIYFVIWCTFLFYSFYSYYEIYDEESQKINKQIETLNRLGVWNSFNLALILLPTTRNNIFSIFLKISQKRVNETHTNLAILALISILIKFLYVIILFPNIMSLYRLGNSNPFMGTLSSIFNFVIFGLSILYIRKKIYELFYYSHRILSILVIIFTSLHSIISLYYLLPAILFYFTDLIIRYTKIQKIIYSNLYTFSNNIENSYTLIKIIAKKEIKTRPGSYFLICMTEVSPIEWHPVYLLDSENNTLTFCIKNNGYYTWTGKLYNYVSLYTKNIQLTKEILIQGPYDCICMNYHNYNYIQIIVSDISIAPIFSILSCLRNKKVHLIWLIDNDLLYKEFSKMLDKHKNENSLEISVCIGENMGIELQPINNLNLSENISILYNQTNVLQNIIHKKCDLIITSGQKELVKEVQLHGIKNRIMVLTI
jgi:hypothetical protein